MKLRTMSAIVAFLVPAAVMVPAAASASAPTIGKTSVTWVKSLPGEQTRANPAPSVTMVAQGGAVVPAGDTACWANVGGNTTLASDPLTFPVGARITRFTADWYDVLSAPPAVGAPDLLVRLWRRVPGIPDQGVAAVWSSGDGGFGSTQSAAFLETVEEGETFYVSSILPISQGDPTAAGLCSVEFDIELGR